jgi:hypothetical protein
MVVETAFANRDESSIQAGGCGGNAVSYREDHEGVSRFMRGEVFQGAS